MKNFLLLVLMFLSIGAFAQKGKIAAAKVSYEASKIDVAKKAIDAAVIHDKTKSNADAWLYRALIYASYDNEVLFSNPLTANLVKDKPTNAHAVVVQSLKKANELGVNNAELLALANETLPNIYFNKAVEAYKAKDNAKMIEHGEQFNTVAQEFETVQNAELMNLLIGEAYRIDDNLEASIPYYKKAIELGAEEEVSYQVLSNYYYNNDMSDEFYAIVKVAKERFPENPDYLLNEIQFMKNNGLSGEELLTKLKAAHEADPSNMTVMTQIGSQYSDVEDWDNALPWFNKALETDGEDKLALFEISRYYLNRAGAELKIMNYESSESTPAFIQAKKNKEKYTALAQPAVEKLYSIVPDDFTALAVKEKYYRLNGETAKADEFMAKKEAANQ